MAVRWAIAEVVLVVWMLLARIESQNLTVSPTYIGETSGAQDVVVFNCSVRNLGMGNHIFWDYYPNGAPPATPIFSTIDNITNNPTSFSVAYYSTKDENEVETVSVDLTIKVATPELAVLYECSVPNARLNGVSHLLVLDDVVCPPSDGLEFTEGSDVVMSCNVTYYETNSNLLPDLAIFKANLSEPELGAVISDHGNTRMLTLNKTLTAEDDNQEYLCVVSFPNSNPPYTNDCPMVYSVLHLVSVINIDPPSNPEDPVTLAVGESVTCTANGKPEPQITWYDVERNVLLEEPQLVITETMWSWTQPVTLYCTANNSLGDGSNSREIEANYTFIVGEAIIPAQSAGVEPWIIAVAVIVPIVVLAAIGIAVFFIIRHRKKKKATKKKTTNGGTAHATTTSSSYSPVATGEVTYTSPSRPPPTTAPRNAGSGSSTRGPPGPDSRNGGTGRGGESPGFGDLGVQAYGGSTQAVNAYPTRGSVHGSNQALGIGVSMNPNPGYQSRGSNPVLNASVNSNSRPNYPYNGSNSALNASLSMNPNPGVVPGVGYGRQPSIASSSERSHASSYNAAIPSMDMNRYPNDLSSMHGSEV